MIFEIFCSWLVHKKVYFFVWFLLLLNSNVRNNELNILLGPDAVTIVNITTHVTSTSSNLIINWQDTDSSSTLPVTQYQISYKLVGSGLPNNMLVVNRTNPPPTSVILMELTSNSNYSISITSLTGDVNTTSDSSTQAAGITCKYHQILMLLKSCNTLRQWFPTFFYMGADY